MFCFGIFGRNRKKDKNWKIAKRIKIGKSGQKRAPTP